MENRERFFENLTRRGFTPHQFATKEEAADYIVSKIHDTTVGIGGSITVQEMGLFERLSGNNTVYWHWKNKEPGTIENANRADAYLCSVNAIAETGEIVNIDGTCNRVAGTLCGPRRVFLLVGKNKLAADLPAAIDRARNVAAPLNARRLNRKTPCAALEVKCHDCRSPERICNAMVTLMKKPGSLEECHVVFIEEELGY